ncbi:carboxylase:pyruvate/acetyl-coa/propionyl-CoA [Dendrothele bispora CBS 962.96]|uniref:Carboxylase:pyruvate/acetyl-coa/propionyl-CoA n=1 Tax=Dendrothele bispora (strain CBS 962.96) TaxID=1314807 RepID=A0A4S8MV52_DENBC|nr:carboxylase:pyruvate/acetyl-coa/propionyl-CoA [Dendrothele bispora CBS 962.96]
MPTLLVANRGEIAIRVLRTARELGWSSVALYTENDTSHVSYADEMIKLDTTSSYMNVEAIVDIAQRTKSTHIHPGYGFLSESVELALACQGAGITFIGPSVETLRVASDKIKSRELATSLGVNIAPGNRVQIVEDVIQFGESAGYPVMIKALDGGGGRGIRIVERPESVQDAFKRCLGESPSQQLFVEKALTGAGWKHVEVQVIGDGTDVVHLWERECSVQRRFQKIVEMAPSSLARDSVTPLIESAIKMAKSLHYKGLGTFEFLFNVRTSDWVFLEINPRIQVEHTVTEEITNIDIVRTQILLSLSEYSLPSLSLSSSPPCRGCSIQLRVTAENPSRSFMLSPGKILAKDLSWPAGHGVRVDTWLSYDPTSPNSAAAPEWLVGTDFDSLLAKVIIRGSTFEEATQKAKRALREIYVGEIVKTNVDVLTGVLHHEDWRSGRIDTLWLERSLDQVLRLGASSTVSKPSRSSTSTNQPPSGMGSQSTVVLRPGSMFNLTITSPTPTSSHPTSSPSLLPATETKHTLTLSSIALNTFPERLSGTIQSTILPSPFSFDLVQSTTSVGSSSSDFEFGDQNNASHVVSPITGKIVELHPAFASLSGSSSSSSLSSLDQKVPRIIKKGDVLAVLSVMKMESVITAPQSGVIERFGNGVRLGVVIGEGMLLAVVSAEVKSHL